MNRIKQFDEFSKKIKDKNSFNEPEEFPLSNMDDISNIIIKNGVKRFEDSVNNNIICESTLNRLLDHSKGKEWGIITADKSQFTKKENIKRNRILRGYLNKKNMGSHQLIGYWQECTEPGVDWDKCPKDKLVKTVERSYFVLKPEDMDSDEFKNTLLDLMTIKGETQDAIIYSDGDNFYLLGDRGQVYDTFNKVTLNKISQAYSRHSKKLNVPFVFEGAEIPGSNSGRMIMKYENIKYLP